MLRLVKWLAYRDRVLDHVDTFLVMYPRGRQFTADFSGLSAAVRAHFDAGVSPMGSALQLSASIIRIIFEQLAPAERETVLRELQSLDLHQLRPLISRQVSKKPEMLRDRVAFTLRLLGGALLMARNMIAEGSLGRAEYAALLAELDKSLLFREEQGSNRSVGLRPPSELFGMERPP